MALGSLLMAGPRRRTQVLRWLRTNLFGSWYDTALTLGVVTLLYLMLTNVLAWALFSADWSPIASNVKLLLVGPYPAEEGWRLALGFLVISTLVGLSWRTWGGIGRTAAIGLTIMLGVTAALSFATGGFGLTARLWLVACSASVFAGYYLGAGVRVRPRWVLFGWAGAFPVALLLVHGFGDNPILPTVATTLWGGLLLTFLLALIGIMISFPLGILLALGRRSALPAVKLFSVLYIELIRGVPLVTLLFMTQVIVPLFLPEGLSLDRMLRALFAITLFSAAYMAENIRGGLQAVPQGQVEAAKSLGLSGSYITLFIVLPQALRAVIPAIVGQFISLFKDTSLVVIVGLLDLVGIGKSIILGNVEWIDAQREVYLFLAVVFWVFTFSMSYASRRLEKHLGVGYR